MVQAAEEHCLVRGRREAHDVTLRAPPVSAKKGVASLPTKGENINICWSPDGNTIAVGSKEDTVSFIDKRTRTIIDKPWPFKMEVLLPSPQPCARSCAAAALERRNKRMSVFSVVASLKMNEISWNNANNLFFMATGDGTVEVYDYPGRFTCVQCAVHTRALCDYAHDCAQPVCQILPLTALTSPR